MDYLSRLRVFGPILLLVACAQGSGLGSSADTTTDPGTTDAATTDLETSSTAEEPTTSEGPETTDTTTDSDTDTDTESDTDTDTDTDPETTDTDETTGSPDPFCGDGNVDPDEDCDDGNMMEGDGCNTNCEPSGQLLWEMKIGDVESTTDQGYAVTVDSDGFFYVGGLVRSPPMQGANAWLTKYSPIGSVVWTYTFNGATNGNDVVRDIAVDATKNVYFTGNSRFNVDHNDDLWVVKLDPDGNLLWEDQVNTLSGGNDRGHGILVTDEGNVIIAGYLNTPSQSNNVWFRQYDPDGENLWTRTYNGMASNNDIAFDIAAASDGTLYIGGHETDGESVKKALLAQYTSAGEPVWEIQFGPEGGLAVITGVAVGPDDDVYTCGFRWHETAGQELWVTRFTSAGEEVWTHTYLGELNDGARAESIAVGDDGALVIGGYEEVGDNKRLLLRKLDSDGTVLWTEQVFGAGTPNDIAHAVAIADNLEVFATGQINEPTYGLQLWIGRLSP